MIKQQAAVSRHRATIIIAGEQAWTQQQAQQLVALLGPLEKGYWITNDNILPHGINVIPPQQVKALLGQESQLLIYDAFTGFNPDHFAAISGTLIGGGLLLLLTPPLTAWAEFNDPEYHQLTVLPYTAEKVQGYFLQWLIFTLNQSRPLFIQWQQGQPLPSISTKVAAEQSVVSLSNPINSGSCATQDQTEAVAAILKVVTGHSKRPLVITADRGRGKSSALGIAAGQLLQQGKRILIVAPDFEAVHTVFHHAAVQLDINWQIQPRLVYKKGWLDYVTPDELSHEMTAADVLFIDEAAAIPTDLLCCWTQHYKRIVFATTVHGYEGTGRGFTVRFQPLLSKVRPQWRLKHLTQPIRWQPHDPLEHFCFEALLLNAEPVADSQLVDIDINSMEFKSVTAKELVQQPPLLKSLFGLLVTAHYRTTPGDLRHLLDGSNLQIWLGLYYGEVVAASLLAFEGGLDQDLAHEIYLGKRRPKGHLLPQTLAAHSGYEQAVGLRCARIIRIAVHPAIQGKGIGRQLVSYIHQALAEKQDYLAVAYGATLQLLDFWQSLGFLPLRLGLTREPSSGCYALIMAKPVSPAAINLLTEITARFNQQFIWLLAELWPDLNYQIVTHILRYHGNNNVVISSQDQQDVYAFGFGNRLYETCIIPLRHWLQWLILQKEGQWLLLSSTEQQLWINKVLQQHSWERLQKSFGLSKKPLLKQMRQTVQQLMCSK